jgi:hypothetical protein
MQLPQARPARSETSSADAPAGAAQQRDDDMASPQGGPPEPEVDPACMVFLQYLHAELQLLRDPDRRQHFTTNPHDNEEILNLSRATLAAVTHRLPERRQQFLDLWAARQALYNTAQQNPDDVSMWQQPARAYLDEFDAFCSNIHFLIPDEVANPPAPAPPAPEPPALPAPAPPALDEEGELVLGVLASARRPLSAKAIWTALHTETALRTNRRGVGMTTIKQRLTDLIHAGLAERPKGPNKGAAITAAGLIHHQVVSAGRAHP